MKKHITLLLLLLPLFMAGQSNFPLVKEGAVWRELVGFLNTSDDKLQFMMQGDRG